MRRDSSQVFADVLPVLAGIALLLIAAGITIYVVGVAIRITRSREELLARQRRAGMSTIDGGQVDRPKGQKQRTASVWRR